jgi:hypothetical protein
VFLYVRGVGESRGGGDCWGVCVPRGRFVEVHVPVCVLRQMMFPIAWKMMLLWGGMLRSAWEVFLRARRMMSVKMMLLRLWEMMFLRRVMCLGRQIHPVNSLSRSLSLSLSGLTLLIHQMNSLSYYPMNSLSFYPINSLLLMHPINSLSFYPIDFLSLSLGTVPGGTYYMHWGANTSGWVDAERGGKASERLRTGQAH